MEEMTMQVSGICIKEGKRMAYVNFTDGKKSAEGIIPECRIVKHTGFDENEVGQLELFMKMNLSNLKKKAASIDPVRAMMKNDK